MNPFDLHGPEFLLFYLIFGFALLAVFGWLRRSGEPEPSTPVNLTDPYEIAYLRGGANEVLRLATVGLVDRGLLSARESRIVASSTQAQLIRHPVDHAILDTFRTEAEAFSLFSNASLKNFCASVYTEPLTRLGMMPDASVKQRRWIVCGAIIAFLWLMALMKIGIALERGRRNLAFLAVLAVLFSIAALVMANVKRTRRGDIFLNHMRSLLGALRARSSMFVPRSNTNEILMLGAVFGMSALPSGAYPYVRTLYPKAAASGSSCGSSCGYSCGSSCGSSCGGGGCGGGCGGCGS
jgi:uncharacterized protein (TIGR04222 family)